jgi:hypothetical protein
MLRAPKLFREGERTKAAFGPRRNALCRYQNGDSVDPDFLAYIRGMVSFAFAAGIVVTFLNGKFLVWVCLLDGELTGGNKTNHVIVHDGFFVGSPGLEYCIEY